jgi:hypothetical protein
VWADCRFLKCPRDYLAFEKILSEAHECTGVRIAAYLQYMASGFANLLGSGVARHFQKFLL